MVAPALDAAAGLARLDAGAARLFLLAFAKCQRGSIANY